MKPRALRFVFLALLVGGLALWNHYRRPRTMAVEIDLAQALPGELAEVDLTFRRGDALLARKDLQFGKEGAPQVLHEELQAMPGEAQLQAELVYRARPAARFDAVLQLAESSPAHAVAPAFAK